MCLRIIHYKWVVRYLTKLKDFKFCKPLKWAYCSYLFNFILFCFVLFFVFCFNCFAQAIACMISLYHRCVLGIDVRVVDGFLAVGYRTEL